MGNENCRVRYKIFQQDKEARLGFHFYPPSLLLGSVGQQPETEA